MTLRLALFDCDGTLVDSMPAHFEAVGQFYADFTQVGDDEVVATLEQMLLHVDMKAGKTCPAPQSILDRLLPIAKAHAALEKPASAGRHVGQRK